MFTPKGAAVKPSRKEEGNMKNLKELKKAIECIEINYDKALINSIR